MPIPSSLTLNYDALLTTTLFNYRKKLIDNISTGNVVFFMLKNKKENGYRSESGIGDRLAVPLMYELGRADTYSGYDVLDTTPTDGMTDAFYDWTQMAVPISISRLEERKNSGEARILNLLESKTKQAELGIQDRFGRNLLQGNGSNVSAEATSPYVSPANSSSGVLPLGRLVMADPTSSTTIGNINQNTHSFWRNQVKDFTGITTNAAFSAGLRNLYNKCNKGPGGAPDLHICDQETFELYETMLSQYHQNPSYQRADIPFDNVAFKGKPVVWDEFVCDPYTPTATPGTNLGAWWMLNLEFWGISYDSETNFINTPFIKPENQDAKVAQLLWLGCTWVSNRRKQGVGFRIPKNTVLT